MDLELPIFISRGGVSVDSGVRTWTVAGRFQLTAGTVRVKHGFSLYSVRIESDFLPRNTRAASHF